MNFEVISTKYVSKGEIISATQLYLVKVEKDERKKFE